MPDIERIPWRPGDTPQWGNDGNWYQAAAPTSGQFWQFSGGLWVAHTLSDADITGMAWTSVPFSAGDFTCLTAGTWTVAAGDVTTFKYLLIGKTMWVSFKLVTTTVVRSGGNPLALQIKIPASKTAASDVIAPTGYILDNGVFTTGYMETSGTNILIFRSDVAQWANATDTTYVYGQMVLETT